MPCFGAMGPMWDHRFHGRPWGRPCHRFGGGFNPPCRKGWLEHLERYAEALREELSAVEAEIQELAPEKKVP